MSRARDIANLIGHTSASSGVHGATGSVVGTTDTQTLINKTYEGVRATVFTNFQSGTSYTLAISDLGRLVTCSNAAAFTLTIPANANVPFPIGSIVYINQNSTGQVSVVGASGVTIVSTPGSKLRAANSVASIIKVDTDKWLLSGDLTP